MFIGVGGDPNRNVITTFPPLSATMVILLGISHAGYLMYKAIPRSQTTGEPTASVRTQSVLAQSQEKTPDLVGTRAD
jgi:hypothetical protein